MTVRNAWLARLINQIPARRGFAYTVGTQIGIQLVGLLTGILVARLLGPTGRGELAAVIAWVAMFAYLGNLGVPVALTYASARYPGQRHQLLGNGLVLALCQFALLALLGWLILPHALASQGADLGHMAVVYLWLYVPLNLVTLYANAIQQGTGNYLRFNIVRFSVPVGYALLLLALWWFGDMSVRGVLAANVLSNVLAMVLAVALLAPALVCLARASRTSWTSRKTTLRELKYGVTAQIGTLRPFTGLKLDILALSLLSTSHELGLYAVALAGANIVRAQGYALGQVVLPETARETDARRQMHIIFRVCALAIAASAAAVCVVAFWSRPLIQLVYGHAFANAAPILVWLVIAAALNVAERVIADGLRGMGHPSISTFAQLIGLAIGIPSLVLCIHYWGGAGAAVAVLVVSLVTLLLVLLLGAKQVWSRDLRWNHAT